MPKQYEGRIMIFNEVKDAASLREELSAFGKVLSCEAAKEWRPALVSFETHAQAERAVDALLRQKRGAAFFYNSRMYDGVEGRGWTTFEQGAGMTVVAHLAVAERTGQLSKSFERAQKSRPKVIDISGG